MTTTQENTLPTTAVRAVSYRWIALGVALAALTTGSVVYQGVNVLIPFWKSTYHLTAASAALGASAVQAGPILSMLFLGPAIDRYGERKVVSSTMILMGLTAFGAAALDPNYPMLLLFITVMGAFYGSILPGGQRAIVRWFPPKLRGMATGIRQAGLPLGASIAAIILPTLALSSGWTAAVYVQGAVAIVGGVAFAAFYREGSGKIGVERTKVKIGKLTAGLVRDPAVRSVLIAGLAMAALQYTFSAQILIFLRDHLRIPIVTAGFIFAVAQGAGIAGRIALAWISDHLWPGKRMRSLQWTALASAVPLIGLTFLTPSSPSWILLTTCVLLGMLGVGWYPLYLVQIAEMAPQNAVASTISFAITLNQIIAAAMPPIFGLIVGWSGYRIGWLLLVVVMLLAAVQLRSRPALTSRGT
jgi:MFS family permease